MAKVEGEKGILVILHPTFFLSCVGQKLQFLVSLRLQSKSKVLTHDEDEDEERVFMSFFTDVCWHFSRMLMI